MKVNMMIMIFVLLCKLPLIHAQYDEKQIIVISAGYNNVFFYKEMLDSIVNQNYKNWQLIYIDDKSTDGTPDLIEQYLAEKPEFAKKITLIKNETHNGSAIENQYYAIHECPQKAIIVILDGDDKFAHNNVFSHINKVYSESEVWLTYGQYREEPSGKKGFCCAMPKKVLRERTFRTFPHLASHLRTFYAGLFHKIKKEDLFYDGSFAPMSGDVASMLSMLEMAGEDHFKFIPEVLMIYNDGNPINSYKISTQLERDTNRYFRSKKPYNKIQSPFTN